MIEFKFPTDILGYCLLAAVAAIVSEIVAAVFVYRMAELLLPLLTGGV